MSEKIVTLQTHLYSKVKDFISGNISPDPEIQKILDEANETLDLNEDLVYKNDGKRTVRYEP